MNSVQPEPVKGELPDFLKRGFPDIGLPPARPRPGAMHFPEMRAPAETWGHDPASDREWAAREWARLIDAGLIGGN